MMFGRREQRMTGARAILKADHRDQISGEVHGHEWEITAWWRWTGASAEVRKHQLEETIKAIRANACQIVSLGLRTSRNTSSTTWKTVGRSATRIAS